MKKINSITDYLSKDADKLISEQRKILKSAVERLMGKDLDGPLEGILVEMMTLRTIDPDLTSEAIMYIASLASHSLAMLKSEILKQQNAKSN